MKNWIEINIINRLLMLVLGIVGAAVILGGIVVFLIVATIAAPFILIGMVIFFNDF